MNHATIIYLLLILPVESYFHIQSFIDPPCGISYTYPTWSIDVASTPHLRSSIAQDLLDQGVDFYDDHQLYYPNCNSSIALIEISALHPLLAQLPSPKPLKKIQKRTMFLDAAISLNYQFVSNSLLRYGIVVIDNISPVQSISSALKKAQLLYNLNLFKAAKTLAAEHLYPISHTGSGGLHLPHFRSDEYLFLDPSTTASTSQKAMDQLRSFHTVLLTKIQNGLNAVDHKDSIIPRLQSTTTPLLTCYGCSGKKARYGAHVDSSTLDFNSKLSITTLLYLSSEVEGGALRVGLMNPTRDDIDGTLDIEPKEGRMVLFLSKYIPHSVEWTYSPRYTMTSFLRHN